MPYIGKNFDELSEHGMFLAYVNLLAVGRVRGVCISITDFDVFFLGKCRNMLGLKQLFNKSVDLIKQVQDQVQQAQAVPSPSAASAGKDHPGRLILARYSHNGSCAVVEEDNFCSF
jgi:hypothetical protein